MIHAVRKTNSSVYRQHPPLTPVVTVNQAPIASRHLTQCSSVLLRSD